MFLRSALAARVQHPWSLLPILLFLVVALLTRDSVRAYEDVLWATGYDKGGYYAYLPAWFIYQDLTFNFITHHPLLFGMNEVETTWGTISSINSYSMGPAMLLAPFFWLGHLEAAYWNVPQDGFSYTYLFWMTTGTIIYVMLGLLALRSVLLRYYNDWPTAAALTVLGLGSNLFFYTTYDFMMSHAHSFSLFSVGLWLAVRWLERPRWATFLGLSAIAGLIAVTRVPNMIYFLVLAFWGVHNKATLVERFQLFGQHWKMIVGGILVFALCFLPSIYYWYNQTGYFFINGYGAFEKMFYWTNPMVAEVLIGYRTGWLIYSPLMILGFIGFWQLYQQRHPSATLFLLYLLLNIYVVSSWFWWWYAGSFGMRPFVDGSAVMAFPIAALFQHWGRSYLGSHFWTVVVVAFVGLNLFQSNQYKNGVIHWNAMSRKAYWSVFMVPHPASAESMAARNKYLIHPDLGAELKRQNYKQTIW